MQKKPSFVPDSEAFNSHIGNGVFGRQVDSSSENNAGNGALFVLFLLHWEVAKAAFRCHVALNMLCQELHDVERRRGWFGF